MNNIVLMASGKGTNALNLIEHAKNLRNVKIVGIIVDRKDSKLLDEKFDIPIFLIQKFKNIRQEEFELRLVKKIIELKGDWILLCGFMRILGNTFLNPFWDENLKQNKVVNIHPSLLPKYKGMSAFKDAYDAKEKFSGITIHFVNNELDAGKIIFQEKFIRNPYDTFENFVAKGKEVEWRLYPKFLDWLENNNLELK